MSGVTEILLPAAIGMRRRVISHDDPFQGESEKLYFAPTVLSVGGREKAKNERDSRKRSERKAHCAGENERKTERVLLSQVRRGEVSMDRNHFESPSNTIQ